MEDGKWNQKVRNQKYTRVLPTPELWVQNYENGNGLHVFYIKTPINTHDKKISNTEYPILNDEVKSIFDIQSSLFTDTHKYPCVSQNA